MKKLLAMTCVLALALAIPALAASFTETAQPAEFFAAYEGYGVVELDFRGDVRYENLSVTVQDMSGEVQNVLVLGRDDDDLTFRIENAKPDTAYSFTVSGVKMRGDTDYGVLTGEIAIPPEGHTVIQSVELDDGGLEIELLGPVEYGAFAVKLTDAQGAELPATVEEREDDGIELRVRGLNAGEEYTVTVEGVGLRGSGVSAAVTRTFVVR